MATLPLTSNGSFPSGSSRNTVRYRKSCDRCQNIKVRCSQDKPACKRCSEKGVNCIYSPLRRIGRPRKTSQIASGGLSRAESAPLSDKTTSIPDSGLSDDYHENSNGSTMEFISLGSITSTTSTPIHETESWNGETTDTAMVNPRNGSTRGDIETGNPPQLNGGLLDGIYTEPLSQRGIIGSCVVPQNIGCITTTSEGVVNQEMTLNTTTYETDCYIAILTRMTKLEQLLAEAPPIPSVHHILEAEHDVRILKHQLFTCKGHTPKNSTNKDQGCLTSDRPILLSLALLAERVVGMLEEIFCIAAVSAWKIHRAIQNSSWPNNQLPVTSARRLERSFRSFLDHPCEFPVPEAIQDLRIGDYVVDPKAKSRAVKRILQLRIKKLLAMLEDVRNAPQRGSEKESTLSSTLDRDSSSTVLGDAAVNLVEDLIRRIESLQGRITLVA